MIYILLSVCCSLIVSVLLKLAKRYHIDVLQAVLWNYSMAAILTWLIFKPQFTPALNAHTNVYLLISILLPVMFLVIAAAIRTTGIVRTDVAQRLSLVIPIVAAFWLFHEAPNSLKIIGIGIGIIAVISSIPWQQNTATGVKKSWLYLLVVFIGMGVIDVLFKEIALFTDVSYPASLLFVYTLSFGVALVILIVQIFRQKTKFSWPHILIGWVLGVANFGNILFYIKAHQALADKPSTVFAAMNIGVVVLGTVVGLAVFKEKLSLLNKIGIALAVAAIIIITNA
jgi:drug/metabolite transporter (DMT)-like permease